MLKITKSKKFNDYTISQDGVELATAHCVSIPADMWSVKRPDSFSGVKFIGVVAGEKNVEKALRQAVALIAKAA